MNINKSKFIVDVLMFVDFVLLAVSGFVLWWALPRGSGGIPFFFLDRGEWLRMHDVTSIILVVLILVHLILNWNWIKCMILGLFGGKNGK